MKISNLLLLFMTLGINQLAFADFETRKAKMLAKIDARVTLLQKKRNCVAAATKKEALKSCKQQFKEEKKALK